MTTSTSKQACYIPLKSMTSVAYKNLLLLLLFFLQDGVSLCSPGCFETSSVDQIGFELTESCQPSASQVLELQEHLTTAQLQKSFNLSCNQ